jgi:phage shock protein C
MHRVIDISLSGHSAPFRLHDDAYEQLRAYLDRARAGLTDDTDQAEVIDDLERSIGEKLVDRLGAEKTVIDSADVSAVLEAVGAVDAAPGVEPTATPPDRPRRRRLMRIREGQEWAGVCTGLAAYAELDANVVRWIFVFLAIVTAGIFLLVYIAAMFILPVVPTRAAFAAAQDGG